MTTQNPTLDPVVNESAFTKMRQLLPWAREPLLHFLILGAVLFGVDHFISGGADGPHVIIIDGAVDDHARQVFKNARGREPNAKELFALRRVWLDNEVLYREGLALGVEKGDAVIRDRVIFKALSMLSADLKLVPADDKVLHDWFEKNHFKYDEPARYDFQEAVIAGERTEVAVKALVEKLQNGVGGETDAGLRVFKGRPRINIVEGYGEAFATSLEQSPEGRWLALPTKDGWRAVQLARVAPGKLAVFESLRGVVMQDWVDATMAEQRSAAVASLARKYTIKTEVPTK